MAPTVLGLSRLREARSTPPTPPALDAGAEPVHEQRERQAGDSARRALRRYPVAVFSRRDRDTAAADRAADRRGSSRSRWVREGRPQVRATSTQCWQTAGRRSAFPIARRRTPRCPRACPPACPLPVPAPCTPLYRE